MHYHSRWISFPVQVTIEVSYGILSCYVTMMLKLADLPIGVIGGEHGLTHPYQVTLLVALRQLRNHFKEKLDKGEF